MTDPAIPSMPAVVMEALEVRVLPGLFERSAKQGTSGAGGCQW